MVNLSSIEESDILRGLTEAELAKLGAIGTECEFRRRDRLFRRGEKADTFYIATRGRFSLTLPLRVFDDYSEMAAEEKEAPEAFGWSSIVAPHTWIYSGYCIEDGAVFAFPGDQLEALLESDPRLGETFLRNLTELIGGRLRSLQDLWLEEVSHSMARVQHWTGTELSRRFSDAMKEPGARRRRFGRRTHLESEG